MEEINLKDLYKYFVKHIKIIILTTLLVLSVGAVYSLFIKKPTYQSSATIAFSTDSAVSSSDISTAKSLSSLYSELIESQLVVDAAVEGTGYSASVVSKALSVSSDSNSGTIKILITYDNAVDAKDLVERITDAFTAAVKDFYKRDNLKIINYAQLPSSPNNIHPAKDFVIYFVVGLFGGILIVFVMFYFDKKIRTNEDVERRVKLPIIGSIRNSALVKNKSELTIKNSPQSGISEDIRTLRANIEFGFKPKGGHVVLMTSSAKSEGKSLISANLAYALALNGKKTLLIDCDLRRGRIHHIFKIDNLNGMSDLILSRDTANINKYTRQIEEKKLYVIPRGVIPLNPSELLSSQNFVDIIAYLRRNYDYIILDGAPILNLSDSLAISKSADKTAIVATVNYTPIDALENSKKALSNAGANIAGVILNKVPISESKYYYHE